MGDAWVAEVKIRHALRFTRYHRLSTPDDGQRKEPTDHQGRWLVWQFGSGSMPHPLVPLSVEALLSLVCLSFSSFSFLQRPISAPPTEG